MSDDAQRFQPLTPTERTLWLLEYHRAGVAGNRDNISVRARAACIEVRTLRGHDYFKEPPYDEEIADMLAQVKREPATAVTAILAQVCDAFEALDDNDSPPDAWAAVRLHVEIARDVLRGMRMSEPLNESPEEKAARVEAGNRFHTYSRGWSDGAKHGANEHAYAWSKMYAEHRLRPVYELGVERGRIARRNAVAWAAKKYGYAPSILRGGKGKAAQ